MARLGKTRIRQNPTVPTGDKKSGEMCPEHGAYPTPREALNAAYDSRRTTDPATSLALRKHAQRLRRTCPACGGPYPSGPDWARAVRERGES